MHLLRRAAARAVSSQPSAFASAQRSFVTRTSINTSIRAQCQPSAFQRRFASEKASPTDATTTGETVPPESTEAERTSQSPVEADFSSGTVLTEPTESEQKQEIVEESIATPETADAAGKQSVTEKVKETASDALEAASRAGAAAKSSFSRRDRSGNSYEAPQPSKILYVGNLYFEIKAEQLERQFKPYGQVVNSKIVTDPNGMSKGFGYIEFDSVESAEKAIKGLDQQVFEGRRMAVQYHVRRQSRPASFQAKNPPAKTLFIGNMSFEMSDKDLNELFREVKNVLDVRVAIDRRNGQPRGFAHADFVDVASAEKGKALLENKTIYGRQLRVDFSRASTTTRQFRE